jgi:hypothetical protein
MDVLGWRMTTLASSARLGTAIVMPSHFRRIAAKQTGNVEESAARCGSPDRRNYLA